jgi:glucose/mannose transport system substrate-binding protein
MTAHGIRAEGFHQSIDFARWLRRQRASSRAKEWIDDRVCGNLRQNVIDKGKGPQETREGRTDMRLRLGLTALALVWAVYAPANAQDMKAEVIHWWTSGGESAAVKVLAEQFAKAGGTWVDTAIAGGVNARAAAISRTIGGTPPTAMQFNTGKQFDDLVENDLLRDVDQLANEEKWKSVIPEAIITATTRNGKMYAVPVNIHGQNWLWMSKAALSKAGASEPTDWEDVFPVLDKLKAAGLIPLAFSGQKVWERNLFNAVLVGKGGNELWTAIYSRRDPAAAKSSEFRAVAETYGKLRGYIDQGAPGRNWNDATNLVIQGRAGMQIMGDWAKGEFAAAGQTAGKEYGCTILSREGGYVMGGDVFAFPKLKDPGQQRAQVVLAKVILDPETQIRFSQKKGSIPVRLDLDVSSLDACAQKGEKFLADKSRQVPAQELLSPPALTGAVEDAISQYWNTPAMSADAFASKIADVLKQSY